MAADTADCAAACGVRQPARAILPWPSPTVSDQPPPTTTVERPRFLTAAGNELVLLEYDPHRRDVRPVRPSVTVEVDAINSLAGAADRVVYAVGARRAERAWSVWAARYPPTEEADQPVALHRGCTFPISTSTDSSAKTAGVHAFAYSPAGQQLAVGTARALVLVDAARLVPVGEYAQPPPAQWRCAQFADPFAPHLLLAANTQRYVVLWDTRQPAAARYVQLFPLEYGASDRWHADPPASASAVHLAASAVLDVDVSAHRPWHCLASADDGCLYRIDLRQERSVLLTRDASGDQGAAGLWASAVCSHPARGHAAVAVAADGQNDEPVVAIWQVPERAAASDAATSAETRCRRQFRDHDRAIIALAWSATPVSAPIPVNTDTPPVAVETSALVSLSVDGRLVARCLPIPSSGMGE